MQHSIVVVILAIFAVWRLSLMVSTDRGPFDVFRKLRNSLDPTERTWYGEGIRCEMCLSFWFGLAVALVLTWAGHIGYKDVFVWWLGLSGGAVFVDSIARK